jgi:hypothetical protein
MTRQAPTDRGTLRVPPLALGRISGFGWILFAVGCGSSNNDISQSPDATATRRDAGTAMRLGADTGASGSCVNGTCSGVCVGSPAVCCPVNQACGSACCGGSSVCLFEQCIVPGSTCRSANDCPSGQYCDPALGPSGDAGIATATDAGVTGPTGLDAAYPTEPGAPPAGATFTAGVACSDPLPPLGKCVPSPPTCPGDAGVPDGAACVASCQYHPPTGALNAVVKWTWGPTAMAFPTFTDVWSTPTVGRMYDTNCDGKIDDLDSPSIVFVSGQVGNGGTGPWPANVFKNGVLRMLNGRTGQEIWSLPRASPASAGFAGNSIAIGDVDGDGRIDIVAITSEGYVVLIDGDGNVKRTSTTPLAEGASTSFAWGGGLAIADLDRDGFPEIIYGSTVFTTTNNAITLSWAGAAGTGGQTEAGYFTELSTAADLDQAPNGHLEILAGNTAYNADGSILWQNTILPDGFSGVGDFNGDGKPEAVLVASGQVWLLNGATGAIELGPFALAGPGLGGPPTIADFDGDGHPEIGIAMQTFYSVVKPDYDAGTLGALWTSPSHDLSSSVTGSTVFDFAGAGRPSVVYGDECFTWVFDGPTGNVLFAPSHMSFTATEASIVADVDGDGHSEIVMVSNGVSPVSWECLDSDGGAPTVVNGVKWTPGPVENQSYRGITVFGDVANSWVGTRTLWNEHTYHVSNICDDLDQACAPPNVYGSIPADETENWTVPWLNNFRQNVQGSGLFNAPDPTPSLSVDCAMPVVAHVTVRNVGQSGLPSGVKVGVFEKHAPMDVEVGTTATTIPLLPSQAQVLAVTLNASATESGTYYAQILIDPAHPTFHECRSDNNTSANVTPVCAGGPK